MEEIRNKIREIVYEELWLTYLADEESFEPYTNELSRYNILYSIETNFPYVTFTEEDLNSSLSVDFLTSLVEKQFKQF